MLFLVHLHRTSNHSHNTKQYVIADLRPFRIRHSAIAWTLHLANRVFCSAAWLVRVLLEQNTRWMIGRSLEWLCHKPIEGTGLHPLCNSAVLSIRLSSTCSITTTTKPFAYGATMYILPTYSALALLLGRRHETRDHRDVVHFAAHVLVSGLARREGERRLVLRALR